ncbi:MAG: MBL fold metallo-hydrolase [Desulfobacterales bacterium]|nr:MBL fold metallo-hydrolase [Desulfobacterales bacterium]
MRFGKYECVAVILDSFLLDGGAMFGVVPKPLWEQKIPADGANRIPMKARSLLIRGNGRVIVVDTGIGDKLSQKFKSIYAIEPGGDSMDDRLARFGIRSEDITDVILSHLHFDHCGGSTRNEKERPVPAFPNAVYHLQKGQWDFALNPSIRDRSSYMAENYQPLLDHKQLNLIDGGTDTLFDGIRIIVTHGHTPAMQHPLVTGENSSLFFCADLIPTSAHLPLAWTMSYDNHPLTLMEEKAGICSHALVEDWILFFAHDPLIAGARIRQKGQGVVVDQAVAL